MEYKRWQNKLKETDTAVREVGEQPEVCVQFDMEQIKELRRQLCYYEWKFPEHVQCVTWIFHFWGCG